ncbi:MAG: Asp-tRNA(Asn)/Glu-tRNA(Gln) amidotransferase subunit GatC [Ruminococcaceae bacterium]|nr:Asp-tRNA(Asn)/Glu-tRNA(Gln) amidotransferase subunit GatC [Oscillospiraceae bacterium]
MKITREEVLHVAKLAKLNLSAEETDALCSDMESIIEFANTLSELDTEGVMPTAHARYMVNAFREDVVKESYKEEDILKNAPLAEDGGFAVPKVVE